MIGVQHAHGEYVEGCFRCDLSSDEARQTEERTLAEWRDASVHAARSFPDEDMDTNVSHRIVYLIDELTRVAAERDRWQRAAQNREVRGSGAMAQAHGLRLSGGGSVALSILIDFAQASDDDRAFVFELVDRFRAKEAADRAIEVPEGMEGP